MNLQVSWKMLNILGLVLSICACLLPFSKSAFAATAVAGTQVINKAYVSYRMNSGQTNHVLVTNTNEFVVSEMIGSEIQSSRDLIQFAAPGNVTIPFKINNLGNDVANFHLQLSFSEGLDFDQSQIVIETNGQEGFQEDDLVYSASSSGIEIPVDGSIIVYLKAGIARELSIEGEPEITLTVKPAIDVPDNSKAGRGFYVPNDPVEKVLLTDGGISSITLPVEVLVGKVNVEKTIEQVVDRDGGSLFNPGSEVTYKIAVQVHGQVKDVQIVDKTPINMQYKPGSLKLDDQFVSDSKDSDLAHYSEENGGEVRFVFDAPEPDFTTHLYITYVID